MNETDRSARGGDDQDGDGEPASRRRRAPALPWAAGGALVLTQVLIVVVAPTSWRLGAALLLAVVTLAVVAWAVFGDR